MIVTPRNKLKEFIEKAAKQHPLTIGLLAAFLKKNYNYHRYWLLALFCWPLYYVLFSNKRIVVYTCIFGGTDTLNPHLIFPLQHKFVDYVCYTDDEGLASSAWKVRKVSLINNNPILTTKYYKILPYKLFPEYEYSVWEDAACILQADPCWLVLKQLRHSCSAAFNHPKRNCIYSEAKKCIEFNLDDEEVIKKQMARYTEEGYPENNGLCETGFLPRNHKNPLLIRTMEDWYSEASKYSRRDQLSFNYVVWKNNLRINIIPGNVGRSAYLKYVPHKRRNPWFSQ